MDGRQEGLGVEATMVVMMMIMAMRVMIPNRRLFVRFASNCPSRSRAGLTGAGPFIFCGRFSKLISAGQFPV